MITREIIDLLVVVVLYNIPVDESVSLISLNKNCIKIDVLVYDNTFNNNNQSRITFFDYLNIKYVNNPCNPGVSKAYNFAAKEANRSSKSLMLLLDQDTYLPSNSLNTYIAAVNNYKEIKLFAPILKFNDKIYSPCNYYLHKGFHKTVFNTGVNTLKHINFLNSGLLIDLKAFNKIKGYDENIRLYFTDFEFINRFKKHYKHYFLLDLVCLHELASTDKSDLNKALNRFKIYCTDAKSASKHFLLWFQYLTTLGLRSIKLSIYFKNVDFIKVFYKIFI